MKECWDCGHAMISVWNEERGTEGWFCSFCGRAFINPKYLKKEKNNE